MGSDRFGCPPGHPRADIDLREVRAVQTRSGRDVTGLDWTELNWTGLEEARLATAAGPGREQ
ncbi:hypothetical protein GZL_00430 [Streptomyces sp. 769]|nr:hypothetical protein GZL_00430 [Streptomyces sp. 769]